MFLNIGHGPREIMFFLAILITCYDSLLLILIYSVIWAIPGDTAGNGQNNI